MTEQQVRAFSIMRTKTSMMESGWMIKQMEREFIYIQMELSTVVNGRMISSMDLELKHGQMEHRMKGNIVMERRMEKEY
jgi:hypothetical protein